MEKELLASVLDEESYQKKFQVLKDPDFGRLYLKSRDHSEILITRLKELLKKEREKQILAMIIRKHSNYIKTVDQGFKTKAGDHIETKPNQEVATFIHDIAEGLKQLIASREENIVIEIDKIGKITTKFHKISLILFGFILFVGVVLSVYIYLQLRPPILKLIRGTQSIAEGNLAHRVDIDKENELGDLALAFNNMCNRLQELERLKGDFLANMSHAFKTPLTTVQEAARLLLDGAAGRISGQQRHLIEIIESDNRNLVAIINNVLRVSRMEAEFDEIRYETFDFCNVIRDAAGKIRLLAEKRKIKIRTHLPVDFPFISGDSAKLSQVMDNLLSNAVKYTEDKGEISIKVQLLDGITTNFPFPQNFMVKKNTRFIGVEVFNSGKPIDRADVPYIFEKFYQGRQKPKLAETRGSGLGLYIAKQFVLKHKGMIWLESVKGKGNYFRFIIPCSTGGQL